MKAPRIFVREASGATAAEFALVLPLLLIFLFGIIDAGRLLWTMNRAEKAAQAGARVAVVTRIVPSALANYSFTNPPDDDIEAVTPGTPVPTDRFESVSCDRTACVNSGVGPEPGFDALAFATIRDRIRVMYPEIQDENLVVDYENVGLGYAGDPYGPDVSPLVTVRLTGLEFTPITLFLLTAIDLPDFTASMTLEDGLGSASN